MIKILFMNSLLCSIPIIKNHVAGDRTNTTKTEDIYNKRYVIEYDFQPPIFGSYKYDPVKQKFDLPEGVIIHNTSTHQQIHEQHDHDNTPNSNDYTPTPDTKSSTTIIFLRGKSDENVVS